jgi:hypothetical protein
MLIIDAQICLAFLFFVQSCTVSFAQDIKDIGEMQRMLAKSQQKLNRIRFVLPALEKDRPDFTRFGEGLTSESHETRNIKHRVDVVETEMFKIVQAGFTILKRQDDITFRIALRHKSFLAALPRDLTITSKSGSTIIKKTGKPIDRPIAPSPTYHVGPDFALAAGVSVFGKSQLGVLETLSLTSMP